MISKILLQANFSRFTTFPSIGHWVRFIFKICQTVEGISMTESISRFFLIEFLAGFCNLAQLYGVAWRRGSGGACYQLHNVQALGAVCSAGWSENRKALEATRATMRNAQQRFLQWVPR